MKTSIDIPEKVLDETLRYSGADTKRAAIITAMEDYVRRKKMAELIKYQGTCTEMMTVEELQRLRSL